MRVSPFGLAFPLMVKADQAATTRYGNQHRRPQGLVGPGVYVSTWLCHGSCCNGSDACHGHCILSWDRDIRSAATKGYKSESGA